MERYYLCVLITDKPDVTRAIYKTEDTKLVKNNFVLVSEDIGTVKGTFNGLLAAVVLKEVSVDKIQQPLDTVKNVIEVFNGWEAPRLVNMLTGLIGGSEHAV